MIRGEVVVVTGGAGFIGSHLVDRLLEQGAREVVVVDDFFLGQRSNLEEAVQRFDGAVRIHRDSAVDPIVMTSIIEEHKPSLVFNLATRPLLYSFANPPGAFRINVEFALVLAELLRSGAYNRLVQISSSEVYGSARYTPMDENHPLDAHTSYAAGKAAADLLLTSYIRMFNLDVMTIRPFNNYGPRQNPQAMAGIVPRTICRIRDGLAPVIEGDGHQTRDFAFVKDTVSAIVKLAERDDVAGKTLNLGAGRETSVRELIHTICTVMGYTGEIEMSPARASDVRRHLADIRAVEALIGPTALTTMDEGLRVTADWFCRS